MSCLPCLPWTNTQYVQHTHTQRIQENYCARNYKHFLVFLARLGSTGFSVRYADLWRASTILAYCVAFALFFYFSAVFLFLASRAPRRFSSPLINTVIFWCSNWIRILLYSMKPKKKMEQTCDACGSSWGERIYQQSKRTDNLPFRPLMQSIQPSKIYSAIYWSLRRCLTRRVNGAQRNN